MLVDALELIGDAEPLADHLHAWSPAPREADSQPPNSSSRVRSRPGMASMAPASAAAVSNESVKPQAGPSSATSSNGTFCATVIITCCSLALGPRLTSQTLLPGVLPRQVRRLEERVRRPTDRAPPAASFRSSAPARPGR